MRRPPHPSLTAPKSVHILGICGRLMGGLAIALKKQGVHVTGADDRQFPPLPEMLRSAGIDPRENWSPEQIPPGVDVVIAGGQVEKENPELMEARRRGIPVCHAADFLSRYCLTGTKNIVVTGTKGKSTTTAMLTWILHHAGRPAGHVIGGCIRRAAWPLVRLRKRGLMVLEGDEYPCGPDDPTPKLLRYRPRDLVITNIQHDHPDIFPSMESYRRIFSDALELLPKDGRLVVNADDWECLELARKAKVPFVSVGFTRASGKRLTGYRQNAAGCAFALDGIPFQLAIWGKMNALNAALAAQAAALQGIGLPESAAALASFPGVSGRQELLASVQKCVVYSDEAYHPAALAPLLDGLKRRHPRRRLVLVLCLVNTGGKSGMAQRELPEILAKAEVVLLFPGYDPKPPPGGPFDHKLLARQLRSRGVQAATATTLPEMEKHLRQHVRNGDIVLIGLSPGPNVAALRLVEAVRGAVQRQRK